MKKIMTLLVLCFTFATQAMDEKLEFVETIEQIEKLFLDMEDGAIIYLSKETTESLCTHVSSLTAIKFFMPEYLKHKVVLTGAVAEELSKKSEIIEYPVIITKDKDRFSSASVVELANICIESLVETGIISELTKESNEKVAILYLALELSNTKVLSALFADDMTIVEQKFKEINNKTPLHFMLSEILPKIGSSALPSIKVLIEAHKNQDHASDDTMLTGLIQANEASIKAIDALIGIIDEKLAEQTADPKQN